VDIYAAEHKKRIVVSWERFPATLYYGEATYRYQNGALQGDKVEQAEEEMGLSQFSIRYSMLQQLKPINPNLFVGVEAGLGIPLGKFSKEWDFDALTNQTGDEEGPYGLAQILNFGGLDDDYKQEMKIEVKARVFPVLAKVLYENPNGLIIDGGVGIYIVRVEQDAMYTEEYVQASGTYRIGDEVVKKLHLEETKALPGLEGSLGYEFNPAGPISFNLEARLMWLSRVKMSEFFEVKDQFEETWVTPDYDLSTIQSGIEFGGLGYGLGGSISFIF
jgi:hypothetical protein